MTLTASLGMGIRNRRGNVVVLISVFMVCFLFDSFYAWRLFTPSLRPFSFFAHPSLPTLVPFNFIPL